MSFKWLERPCALPDDAASRAARQRQSHLTKPPGSLGRLEDVAITLCALQRRPCPVADRVWITVFAADHGVAAEGVSAFPQAVTGEMLRNFAHGGGAISVLARTLGATLEVVNLGTVNDVGELQGVRRSVIAPQTANFCEAPAMTEAQLDAALAAGQASVERAVAADTQIFIGGDMGITNTTAATALACALLGAPAVQLAGAGTGLDAAGVAHKVSVIERALARGAAATTPLDRLRWFGGFEIAALAGAYVAAAHRALPVLVDGFIATAAALAAVHIQPAARAWLLFSHRSQERGHTAVLQALRGRPLLDLSMRLGEASGAAVAVPLLRLACALHNGMATFAEASVSEALDKADAGTR